MKFHIKENAILPTRGTDKSAGIDFYIPKDFTSRYLYPNQSIKIHSGVFCEIPDGYAFIAYNRTSIADKGIIVGGCVVDQDYQGEIIIHLLNVSDSLITLTAGTKIVQLLLVPILYENIECVDNLKDLYTRDSQRGAGSFGSTDKK
jgi:dUTP pyrophosphatase